MPIIRCKEVMPDLQRGDCTWEAEADSEEELKNKFAEHVCNIHGIKEVPPAAASRIKKVIKKKAK